MGRPRKSYKMQGFLSPTCLQVNENKGGSQEKCEPRRLLIFEEGPRFRGKGSSIQCSESAEFNCILPVFYVAFE